MFDREVIKKELMEAYELNPNKNNFNWDLIVDAYQMIDGWYVFRIEDDAYFFDDNNCCIDCCPGYFLIM